MKIIASSFLTEVFGYFLAFLVGTLVGRLIFLHFVTGHPKSTQRVFLSQFNCCQKQPAWYGEIPVLGYLLLRGKCQVCGRPISLLHPLSELMGGLYFLLSLYFFGLHLKLIPVLIFGSSLIAIFFIDLKESRVPNRIIFPLYLVGVIFIVLAYPERWTELLISSAAAGGLFVILALLVPGGMGMGDVKLAATMGVYLGYPVFPGLMIAFVTAALTGLFLILAKKKTRKDYIPFAPHLVLGAIISLFWGAQIMSAYKGLF